MSKAVEHPMERDIVHPEIDWATAPVPDLHALMADLRARGRFHPVRRQGKKALLVTRFADVHVGFGDEQAMPLYAGARLFAEPAQGRSLFSMTGEEHRLHRSLVAAAFTPAAIDRYEAEFMMPEARRLLEALAIGRTPVDFIQGFAEPFGLSQIVRILGLPEEADAAFRRWAHDLVKSSWDLDLALAASREFEAYVLPVIRQRRDRPGDDVISRLAVAEVEGKRLTDIEIVSFLRTLFPAGADTTFRQTGNFLAAMLTLPGLKERILADRGLIPPALDEALRWEPALGVYPRLVPEDVTWRGAFIPGGTFLLLGVASANRDPEVFEDPDRFDPERRAKRITTFGAGIHFCIGAVLARRQMAVAINTLLDLYPGLSLAEAPRILGATLRGPERLMVQA
jgi:cytochrome P450